MPPARKDSRLPSWTIVRDDDPRERAGAVEPGTFASAEWASTIVATSNRAWTNAAKVIAHLVDERPEARYVEGWASNGFFPVWHAWVDVPLGTSARTWLRIDPTPLWRWTLTRNWYGPVIEACASEMAPLLMSLLKPRGRPLCRLPLVPLATAPRQPTPRPTPTDSLRQEFGTEVAYRSSEILARMTARQRARSEMARVDVRAEMDRLEAMRVLPRGVSTVRRGD